MRNDDADQRRHAGEITHAVKHIDRESEDIVRDDGSRAFVRNYHCRLHCDGIVGCCNLRWSLLPSRRFKTSWRKEGALFG